jgi:TrmH family RNA methyltransferase
VSVRRSERAFVVEGPKLLGAALDAGAPLEALFHAPEAQLNEASFALLDRAAHDGVRSYALLPGVIERVADTVNPQPVLGIVGFVPRGLEALPAGGLALVLVDVRDPGNVGAILRSADAAGVDVVICSAGTADLYNPKTVRASAGSLFHLPVLQGGEAAALLDALGAAGWRRLATRAEGGEDYALATLEEPLALVLGNEANGLDAEIAARLDGALSIPIQGGAESLNVAMAATVLCFELARRRRAADAPRPSMG